MIYGLTAALYGILISLQNAFCATLTNGYGNWFSSLCVHLTGLLALTPFFFTAWGRKKGSAPWYLYLGGAVGAVNIVFGNYGIVHLGMTASNVIMLLGEMIFAMLLDGRGLMGAEKRRMSGLKWCAVGVMALGCLSIRLLEGGAAVFDAAAIVCSLLRGVTLVIFRQLNGQLGVRAGTGYATWMNYATGTAAAFIVFALLGFPMQAAFPTASVPVWAYFCGVIGCCGIFLCNLSSPKLSTLTMTLIVFVSETAAGIGIDLVNGTLSVPTVIGCAIASVGMVINLIAEKPQTERKCA